MHPTDWVRSDLLETECYEHTRLGKAKVPTDWVKSDLLETLTPSGTHALRPCPLPIELNRASSKPDFLCACIFTDRSPQKCHANLALTLAPKKTKI